MFCKCNNVLAIISMYFPNRQHFLRPIFAEVRSPEGHVSSQVISKLKDGKKRFFVNILYSRPKNDGIQYLFRWANIAQDSWEHRAALPGFLGNVFQTFQKCFNDNIFSDVVWVWQEQVWCRDPSSFDQRHQGELIVKRALFKSTVSHVSKWFSASAKGGGGVFWENVPHERIKCLTGSNKSPTFFWKEAGRGQTLTLLGWENAASSAEFQGSMYA